MSFFKTLSEKLGFIADESDDDRNDDELEDGEVAPKQKRERGALKIGRASCRERV